MILNIEQYKSTKDLLTGNNILKSAVLSPPENGKEFFLAAFKKDRYLDMKLTAVRGYAEYATEEEVNKLMSKMLELLIKSGADMDYVAPNAFGKTYKEQYENETVGEFLN